MIRVYAKQTYALGKPGDIARPLTVCHAGEICDVPDWVTKELTFQWAVKDGDIQIIQNKEQEIKAELDIVKNPVKKPRKTKE